MRSFKHFDAGSIDECVSLLRNQKEKTCIIAGGVDIIQRLRNRIGGEFPEILVNIKTIENLDYIVVDEKEIRIGALTKLEQIAKDRYVYSDCKVLSEAAQAVGAWQHRNMITIAGNLCQAARCWYYHYPHDRYNCLRKGGKKCYAKDGDTRYLSIFGDIDGCIAVNSSDIVPALIVLGTQVVTDRRTVSVEDFFKVNKATETTVLERDEVIKEIRVQKQTKGTKSKFLKFRQRQAIDYPIVNAAVSISFEKKVCKTAKICLNSVYPTPYRLISAENVLIGKNISKEIAENAGEMVVRDAMPLLWNEYKIQIAKTLVKRAIIECI